MLFIGSNTSTEEFKFLIMNCISQLQYLHCNIITILAIFRGKFQSICCATSEGGEYILFFFFFSWTITPLNFQTSSGQYYRTSNLDDSHFLLKPLTYVSYFLCGTLIAHTFIQRQDKKVYTFYKAGLKAKFFCQTNPNFIK